MRTSDGKLVILDFGLMTEVTESQRIGLVEFIAHLTMEDWDGLTQDLVTLGFMPEDMPEEAKKHIRPVMKEVSSCLVYQSKKRCCSLQCQRGL
jgi:aarF domain-containing kinase